MQAFLYNIRSTHNVGSMFRTADSTGIEKLYLCGITPSPFDRFGNVVADIKKTALGAEHTVAWEKIGLSASAHSATCNQIRLLQSKGYVVYAIEQAHNALPLSSIKTLFKKAKGLVAFVVGNEVTGVPQSVLKACNAIIELPMYGHKESLNVSVAFGVVAYYLRFFGNSKRRNASRKK